MVQPLRKLIPLKKYKGSGKLIWTPEAIAAFEFCQVAISNYQELYFLEDTATPILQTDASDYGIGGYVFMVTNGKDTPFHVCVLQSLRGPAFGSHRPTQA